MFEAKIRHFSGKNSVIVYTITDQELVMDKVNELLKDLTTTKIIIRSKFGDNNKTFIYTKTINNPFDRWIRTLWGWIYRSSNGFIAEIRKNPLEEERPYLLFVNGEYSLKWKTWSKAAIRINYLEHRLNKEAGERLADEMFS